MRSATVILCALIIALPIAPHAQRAAIGQQPAPAPPAPAIGIPNEIKPIQGYATWEPGPETTARGVTYIALSGADPLPPAILRDARIFALPTRGLAAGRYRFLAVYSLGDVHRTKEFAVTIGDTPPTPPGPPPGPEPPGPKPPNPTAERVWVVVVEETSERTPAIAAVVTDTAFWQSLSTAGVLGWEILDKDAPDVAKKNYAAVIERAQVKLPALIILNDDGKPLSTLPLPPSTELLRKRITTITGKP